MPSYHDPDEPRSHHRAPLAPGDSPEAVTLRTDDTAVGGLLAVVELERGDTSERYPTSSSEFSVETHINVESFEAHEAEVCIGLQLFQPAAEDDADVAARLAIDDTLPKVRDVMTPAPTCIDSQATILQIVRLVHAKKFRHLLITDEQNELVGVVSDRDLVRCFGPGDFPDDSLLEKMRAADVMSTDVVAVGPETSVAACIDEMLSHGINCLPVVVGRRPVGILTTADLLRLLRERLTS
ncbi:MAG: hypothetical protein C0483_03920 [Pirellula sp.]|nr:hypothetical protein [Pirellula sp.]